MKALTRLLVEAGWRKDNNIFYADISDISGHQRHTQQPVKCPKCHIPVNNILTHLTPDRDNENDIMQWSGVCPNRCGAHLVIYND